jgi:hypothetical protein
MEAELRFLALIATFIILTATALICAPYLP